MCACVGEEGCGRAFREGDRVCVGARWEVAFRETPGCEVSNILNGIHEKALFATFGLRSRE